LHGIALVFVSCDLAGDSGDDGYQGDSLTVSGLLRYRDKDDKKSPDTDGTLELGEASALVLDSTAVTPGAFSDSIGLPDSVDTAPWADILPAVAPALTIRGSGTYISPLDTTYMDIDVSYPSR